MFIIKVQSAKKSIQNPFFDSVFFKFGKPTKLVLMHPVSTALNNTNLTNQFILALYQHIYPLFLSLRSTSGVHQSI